MKKKFVSCFDIGEVPRSHGKWNWNWLYFLPFIFNFEQGVVGSFWGNCSLGVLWGFFGGSLMVLCRVFGGSLWFILVGFLLWGF